MRGRRRRGNRDKVSILPSMDALDAPTFSDITMATALAFSKFPVNATPLDERFEHLDAFWQRWQRRPAFQAAYVDPQSGVPELDNRTS
jgi:glutathione S-transferase